MNSRDLRSSKKSRRPCLDCSCFRKSRKRGVGLRYQCTQYRLYAQDSQQQHSHDVAEILLDGLIAERRFLDPYAVSRKCWVCESREFCFREDRKVLEWSEQAVIVGLRSWNPSISTYYAQFMQHITHRHCPKVFPNTPDFLLQQASKWWPARTQAEP